MRTRDDILKEIRISLSIPEDTTEKSDIINFQNKVLRPILKQQNECFVLLFCHYIEEKRIKWTTSQPSVRIQIIGKSLRNDVQLKSLLIGSVIGFFSSNELKLYQAHKREIHKRIIHMIESRLIDQLINLAENQ